MKSVFEVYTSAVHSSMFRSSIGSSITSISRLSASKGVTFSICLPLSSTISDFQSITISHCSLNCQETAHISAIDHPDFQRAVLID